MAASGQRLGLTYFVLIPETNVSGFESVDKLFFTLLSHNVFSNRSVMNSLPGLCPQISFAFDIGHASIGWAVFQEPERFGEAGKMVGTGSVIFPKDDCQNHERAALRRQRRHIAATRNRVRRLRDYFVAIGALSASDEQTQKEAASGVMAPWLLAAQALNGRNLSWKELWQVVRWYAHNRGYDGNAAWADREEADNPEDTEKVKRANALMEEAPQTHTMAETICKYLGVSLDSKTLPMGRYFKGANMAFPREVVIAEVRRILAGQKDLRGCDAAFLHVLLEELTPAEKKQYGLPERYQGSLLFGQMIPRFDNRIISQCPISGEKTPLRHCPEYYRFRWGMVVANIRVETDRGLRRVLTPSERKALTEKMETKGWLTKTELKNAVEEISGANASPLDAQFFTRETEDALILDPVRREVSAAKYAPIWQQLSTPLQRKLANQFFRKGTARLESWREDVAPEELTAFEKAIDAGWTIANKSRRKQPLSHEEFLRSPLHLSGKASGRAPYSRALLTQAFEEVMAGLHPHARAENQPESALYRKDGCLARTEAVLEKERERSLDEQTNNHLVRQRILIFKRLLSQLFNRYAEGEVERVAFTTIEVARDLVEFSGMNAKEKAALFSSKAKPFQDAEKHLRKQFEDAGITQRISYALIRKARIAIAQDWTCPYTGRRFGPFELIQGEVDIDHIIPRSRRPSDSLDNLVIAFSEANKRKSNRLPLEMIRDEGGSDINTGSAKANGQIVYEGRFREFVDKLPPKRDPRTLSYANDEDFIRWRRKQNLLLERYDERDADFTPGALTVTSHLNKLAALEARKFFHQKTADADLPSEGSAEHRVGHVPGNLTHYFQTRWNLLQTLGEVCPEVIDETDHDRRLMPKGEIRNITHLHHAIDAIALALMRSAFRGVIPKALGEAILRRKARPEERLLLEATNLFFFDSNQKHHPKPLPEDLRSTITQALGEKRVVQHVPADMRGMLTEQTQWRVIEVDEDGKATVAQYGPRDPKTGKRVKKEATENSKRLLGFAPKLKPGQKSKLKPRKAAIVIKGNYGIALLETPVVIPFHRVWKRLEELKQDNGGRTPQVLRAGQIIHVPKDDRFGGYWRIHSVKDNTSGVAVDMARPELVKAENRKEGCKMNVRVASLLKAGMTIEKQTLLGP